MKRTKIVATIGPASESKETLKQMIEAGMNVARINFSHSDHAYNGGLIKKIQELREEMGIPVGIMADLQGPRIRMVVKEDTKIDKSEMIRIVDVNSPADFNIKSIGLDQKGIIKNLKIGDSILIEDGKIRLKVIKKEENFAEAEVEEGGVAKNHKGVNLPDTKLDLPAITEKDEEDLKFAMAQNVEFVAMSFVGNAEDIWRMKNKIKEYAPNQESLPWLVAKIERKEAIKNLDEIVKATDAVMVARGDLGIEMPESEVAILQKEIVIKSLQCAKPVIVATQMMDSMIENPIPTRAEVSDVTNAVIDHADAVMLSGESANGQHPIEAVKTMAEIIEKTEVSPFDDFNPSYLSDEEQQYYAQALEIIKKAKESGEENISIADETGQVARLVSNRRLKTLAVATKNKKLYNQLSVVWGILPKKA